MRRRAAGTFVLRPTPAPLLVNVPEAGHMIIAEKPAGGLIQAFTGAGAFPIVETRWTDATAALISISTSRSAGAGPDDSGKQKRRPESLSYGMPGHNTPSV